MVRRKASVSWRVRAAAIAGRRDFGERPVPVL